MYNTFLNPPNGMKYKISLSLDEDLFRIIEELRHDDLPRSLVYTRLLKKAIPLYEEAVTR